MPAARDRPRWPRTGSPEAAVPKGGQPGAPRPEPVPLRPRGGHDPAAVLLLLMVVFVAAAVLKPWDRGGPRVGNTASLEPATEAPSGAPTSAPDIALVTPLEAGTVAPLLLPRDAWGISALVVSPADGYGSLSDRALPRADRSLRLGERWTPARPDVEPQTIGHAGGTAISDGDVELPTGTAAVIGLAFTTPDAQRPLEVRIWRYHFGGPPQRLLLEALVAGTDPQPWRPPRDPDGTQPRAWHPGDYRADLLFGDRIARIVFAIPGPAPFLAGPSVPALRLPEPAEVAALPEGLFAVVDGRAIHVDAAATSPLDELAAWLEADLAVFSLPVVGVAPPRTEALGLVLAPGDRIERVRLTRLAPDGRSWGPAETSRYDDMGRVVAIFPAPRRELLAAGVYRLEARWDRQGNRFTRAWHVDVPVP